MQRISVTASLNGMTIQFEQAAFDRLEAYLAEARRALAGNPDQAEILTDLEQAIAEQCQRRMRLDAVRVTLRELEPALAEIGSVEDSEAAAPPPSPDAVPRRLEQVSEGALLGGVCQGVARYFRLDVTLVRVIALLLLLLSAGIVILIYAGMMLLLPYATPEAGAPPVRRIPARCRELVLALRTRLDAATS
ncbi:MAG: PspC domain-containing protein [Gammaproteobacteria bacterium]|nr:PspC domain-containing protein [Gammaproteobacteria bacterium]